MSAVICARSILKREEIKVEQRESTCSFLSYRETRLGPLAAATTHHPHRQPNKFPMMMTTIMNPVSPATVNSPKRSLPSPTKSATVTVKKQSTSSSPGMI